MLDLFAFSTSETHREKHISGWTAIFVTIFLETALEKKTTKIDRISFNLKLNNTNGGSASLERGAGLKGAYI